MKEILTKIVNEAIVAIDGYLRRATVPIIVNSSSGAGIQGAGSLFHVRGRTYLVTAAHIVANEELPLLRVPRGPQSKGADLVSLARAKIHVLGPKEHDVALAALDEAGIVDQLSSDWVRLSPDNVTGRLADATWFVVAGFPQGLASLIGTKLAAEFNKVVTSKYLGETKEAVDPEVDLMLHYGTVVPDTEGNPSNTPKLPGDQWIAGMDYAESLFRRGVVTGQTYESLRGPVQLCSLLIC